MESSVPGSLAGSEPDFDLTAYAETQDPSFKYSSRKQKSPSVGRVTSSREYQGPDGTSRGESEQQLLLVLCVMGYHRVQHFLIPPTAQWNKRRALGEGVSFAVEEASLPVWRILNHISHRHPHGRVNQKQISYFTDHTGTRWDSNTRVAFKVPGKVKSSLLEIIQELWILCHPSLHNHPYIVQLLGVAWVRRLDNDAVQPGEDEQQRLRRDQPTIVIEHASHGSLYDFLGSSVYAIQRVSLETKVRLCMNLLDGMLTLRACGVAHGDIKPENALIYDTYDSTAENWKAKLSDFGNAVVGLDTQPNELQEMFYSELYAPPELPGGNGMILSSLVEKADVWGWGMLLWHVMIDGKLLRENYWRCDSQFYHEKHRLEIDQEQLWKLKEEDELSTVAADSCEAYLICTHTPAEIALAREISTILKSTLVKDPSKRPTISGLLLRLVKFNDGIGRMAKEASLGPTIKGDYDLKSMPVPKPLADMPFFDFTQHIEIRDLSTVLTSVLNALKSISNSNEKEKSLQAHLQMSLCYATGISGQVEKVLALDHLWKAASGGLKSAQALMVRIHGALGIELPQESMTLFRNSFTQPTMLESVIATSDLIRIDYQAYQTAVSIRARGFNKFTLTLLQACMIGDLVAAESLILQRRDIHAYGASGETALHWLALIPCEHSQKLAALLLDAGLGPGRATTRQTDISGCPNFLRTIPAGTTPMHWALETDNEPVLRTLLECFERTGTLFYMASLLCTVAQCQSSNCLLYLCTILHQVGKSADIFDSRGFSALYFAISLDPVEQVLRYVPGGPTRHQSSNPYKERHLAVIESLLGSSSAMSVSPYGFFNVIHLAAALDTPDVLDLLEKHESRNEPEPHIRPTGQTLSSVDEETGSRDAEFSLLAHSSPRKTSSLTKLLNEHDDMGMTALNVTIARGILGNFKWLLDHGANPNLVNCNYAGHAIHICATLPGRKSISFAKELLRRDRRCLNLQTAWGFTPLHHAALYGHTALADHLITMGADLNAHNGGRATVFGNVTPLGAAIASRSFPMVKFLCEKLKERNHPWHAHAWYGARKDALQYLLRPGVYFYLVHASDGSITPWDQGCYDHPFSKVSKQILDYLLEEWPKSHVSMGQRTKSLLRIPFTIGTFQMDPIHWAVRMTNIYAIERLIESNHYKGDFRDLLAVAYRQLLVGSTHVARNEEIESMITDLQSKQNDYYKVCLQHHDPSKHGNPLSRLFRTYLQKYLIMEQQQYRKALDWMSENRLSSRPAMLEHRGADQWVPGYRARFALIWALLVPMAVGLIVTWCDPTAQFTVSNIVAMVFMIVLTNINVIWLKLIRIATIFYGCRKTKYPAIDPKLTVIQILLTAVAMAFSVLNIWLLHNQTHIFIRYSFIDCLWDSGPCANVEILGQTYNALNVFYNTTCCLIAYTVVAQLLFQVFTIIFLYNRWTLFGMGPEFDPHRLPFVDQPTQQALTARYGITFRSFARPVVLTHPRFYIKNPEHRRDFCV